MAKNFISLTDNAKNHFLKLIQEEGSKGLNLRMEVMNPGTARAEVSLAYCPKNKQEQSDIEIDCNEFKLYIDKQSINALQDAVVDFAANSVGGELIFKAPNIYGKKLDPNEPLIEQIKVVVESEINPMLANHNGSIRVVDITQQNELLLEFSGGCKGCGMTKLTLDNYIEKVLFEKFPVITAIKDITNHAA